MPQLPPFNADGLLPVGDYPMTAEELLQSHLVAGGPEFPTWDEAWRVQLVRNLAVLADQLRDVGIDNIFIDGSFTEAKDHPNDIDGYVECTRDFLVSGALETELNLRDRHRVWTWSPHSRRRYHGYAKPQLPMWHVYRVELYPHMIDAPQPCGIRDRHGNELEFPAAFRLSRGDQPRGIVQLIQESSGNDPN